MEERAAATRARTATPAARAAWTALPEPRAREPHARVREPRQGARGLPADAALAAVALRRLRRRGARRPAARRGAPARRARGRRASRCSSRAAAAASPATTARCSRTGTSTTSEPASSARRTRISGARTGRQLVRNSEFNCASSLGDPSVARDCAGARTAASAPRCRRSSAARSARPGLRNLSATAPYLHDGRFATLEEVLDYYRQPPDKAAVAPRAARARSIFPTARSQISLASCARSIQAERRRSNPVTSPASAGSLATWSGPRTASRTRPSCRCVESNPSVALPSAPRRARRAALVAARCSRRAARADFAYSVYAGTWSALPELRRADAGRDRHEPGDRPLGHDAHRQLRRSSSPGTLTVPAGRHLSLLHHLGRGQRPAHRQHDRREQRRRCTRAPRSRARSRSPRARTRCACATSSGPARRRSR